MIMEATARTIRNSLPNATYIGFTGTPISNEDRFMEWKTKDGNYENAPHGEKAAEKLQVPAGGHGRRNQNRYYSVRDVD